MRGGTGGAVADGGGGASGGGGGRRASLSGPRGLKSVVNRIGLVKPKSAIALGMAAAVTTAASHIRDSKSGILRAGGKSTSG
jgi:hypothetical protein